MGLIDGATEVCRLGLGRIMHDHYLLRVNPILWVSLIFFL